jgi:hypothetical protein
MAKTLERQGVQGVPMVRHYPIIYAGTCESCGVMDSNAPATDQYKLCRHYKDMGEIRCSYCPEEKDPSEVIGHSKMIVTDHPTNPNQLVAHCDSFSCSQKHIERFKTSL